MAAGAWWSGDLADASVNVHDNEASFCRTIRDVMEGESVIRSNILWHLGLQTLNIKALPFQYSQISD